MAVFSRISAWAHRLKRDVMALWIAARDHRVSWYAKALAGVVAAYAFSPLDLIPDFIPVIGYLDDVLIVPAGIWLVVKLIPPHLMMEFREAAALRASRPASYVAAAVIVALWIAAVAGLVWLATQSI